ncbi:hypothetical protein DESUT3_04300 [Desulfuromonas versatilis]|uniref:histidine kinase n=1 Tax=Desulfuromonas versatilis TaxID=2802975 RepID=A0ABM8HP76_9BACT|nr:DUF3365 domain-containing protein [Desulfuromonas versatilis]BCR03361.1 hypothetical protein DESUT3_04300 [Desulfuromonas versatilis]
MGLFRNLGLLTKIVLLIGLILISFFVLSSMISYRQQRAFIIEESVEKARIIASEAVQAREYISQQLQVGNIPLSEQRYGMIPVVASNRIGQRVAEDLDYRIRQVSNRYRNPKNAPDAFEAEVLDRFVADAAWREHYAITELDGQPVFRYLQAFTADQSCLECHSDPAVAPEFIKTLFPPQTDQAYHYKIGEVIGAASVTIPMDKLERQILANFRNDTLLIGGIFLVLITCLGLLTRFAVTRPLGLLGEAIGEIVRTGRFEEKLPPRGRDEIGRLIEGFNEMIEHLGEKTSHLEESEKRFRVLTETARDGIISFLANGQIILFNRQAERIFGYSKREALGLSVDRLIHEECTSLGEQGVEAYLKQNCARLMQELNRVTGRRRDGTRLTLEFSLSVAESDGHLFYTVIVRESH